MQSPLDVAISPCPNDTFAFFGLTENARYRLHYLDIEELNRSLLTQRFAIAKGSFALIDRIAGSYTLLPVGAAIGYGVGPVLVGKLFNGCRVALPGENTTAHRLFHFYRYALYPKLELELRQMPFDTILPALRQGHLDAAVLIHEGRFVYARAGLPLIADLGEWYEKKTGAMIPLGALYALRSLPETTVSAFVDALKNSLATSRVAFAQKSSLYSDKILPFMRQKAQEPDTGVIEAHVQTYVSADTEWLSEGAMKSIDIFRQYCLA